MTARAGGPATLPAILPRLPPNLEKYASRVVFHPGWIPDKFADVGEKKFCFVHIDVDLYEPTRDALALFGQRLAPGGILICDDSALRPVRVRDWRWTNMLAPSGSPSSISPRPRRNFLKS